mmetsp:Transcript_4832/g.7679  ORF Transcript_4832/g.7679 Transcript_4832/m.7679 type:complete len:606 (-) Transcript_4832:8-1825(-)
MRVLVAALVSDSVRGSICVVCAALLLVQISLRSQNIPKQRIHRAALVGVSICFVAFFGHREPVVLPWQIVGLCHALAGDCLLLISSYVLFVVLCANFRAAKLTKYIPRYYKSIFIGVAIVVQIMQWTSIVLTLALNRIKFFAIRSASYCLGALILGTLFTKTMYSLYHKARMMADRHVESTRSHGKRKPATVSPWGSENPFNSQGRARINNPITAGSSPNSGPNSQAENMPQHITLNIPEHSISGTAISASQNTPSRSRIHPSARAGVSKLSAPSTNRPGALFQTDEKSLSVSASSTTKISNAICKIPSRKINVVSTVSREKEVAVSPVKSLAKTNIQKRHEKGFNKEIAEKEGSLDKKNIIGHSIQSNINEASSHGRVSSYNGIELPIRGLDNQTSSQLYMNSGHFDAGSSNWNGDTTIGSLKGSVKDPIPTVATLEAHSSLPTSSTPAVLDVLGGNDTAIEVNESEVNTSKIKGEARETKGSPKPRVLRTVAQISRQALDRERKDVAALRKIFVSSVAGIAFSIFTLIASLYVTVNWASSTQTVREYYSPDEYFMTIDIFTYAFPVGYCFLLYYSWISWPKAFVRMLRARHSSVMYADFKGAN